MKTALLQLNATGDKKRNVETALALVSRAAGKKAKFILLPEAFNFRGRIDPRRGFRDIAEKVPGPSTAPFMEAAKKYKVAILAGSVCESIPGSKKVYNTSVLIDARGRIAAKYRKRNLFDAVIGGVKIRESGHIRRGNKSVTVKVGAWTAGLSICYDLRFPGLYQEYARAGADLLCVPSVFTRETGRAHWEILLRARAIENRCFVLAPNQIGKDGKGVASYGNSMIISPWGTILARASADKEEIVFADLDHGEIARVKTILPPQK